MSVPRPTADTRTAETIPTIAVATHGDLSVGWTVTSQSLITPGQARVVRAEERMLPNERMIASVALKIASATPSDTMVVTAELAVASRKSTIGVELVVRAARSGAPSSTAVVGMSSAATVMTRDQRMAVAMWRLEPFVSSEKLTAFE